MQCDEGKPGCNNCARSRSRVACPGYENELIFREEDPQQRRVRKHSSIHHKKPTSHLATHLQTDTLPTTTLQPCWGEDSIAFFFNQHVLPAQSAETPGHLECLPSLYFQAESNDCLRHATDANAYLSLYQYSKSEYLRIAAYASYERALIAMRVWSQSSCETVTKDHLGAVLLLSMFEVRPCLFYST